MFQPPWTPCYSSRTHVFLTLDLLLYMLLSLLEMLPQPEAIPTDLSEFCADVTSSVRPFRLLRSLGRVCFTLLCVAVRLHVHFYRKYIALLTNAQAFALSVRL